MTKSEKLGHRTEYLFAFEAVSRGHRVIFPPGVHSYDVIVSDYYGHLVKVQVKAAGSQKARFKVKITKNAGKKYRKRDCDVIAIYVVKQDSWFIFPRSLCPSSIALTDGRNSKLEKYRDAWHFLKGEWL